jgi:hypothetical protein
VLRREEDERKIRRRAAQVGGHARGRVLRGLPRIALLGQRRGPSHLAHGPMLPPLGRTCYSSRP